LGAEERTEFNNVDFGPCVFAQVGHGDAGLLERHILGGGTFVADLPGAP
jgi:hypothetical protein